MEPDATRSGSLPALPRRFFDVFFSPGQLFEKLRVQPFWFGALALGATLVLLASILTAYGLPAHVWQDLVAEQIRARGQEVPANLDGLITFSRLSVVIGGVLYWFVGAFLLAGILTLIFSFVLGHGGSYKQYLAVVSHGGLITSAGALLTVPLRILQSNPRITLSVGTFLGALLGGEGYLYRVVNAMDLFQLWSYLTIALGASVLGKTRSWGSAVVVMLVLAVIRALLFGIPAS
jgi:hypothetical protein